MYAAERAKSAGDYKEIFDLLLERGANIDLKNKVREGSMGLI
jgi:hypothetical protein